tara:strand:- start:3186 stop:3878 length:693 start_codon:yes stop_codon:yes gene_type:complete
MEDIVETKGIEKIEEVKIQETADAVLDPQQKPKRKPRTEAQKAAFEKARKKRAENLAKKKLEEEGGVSPAVSQSCPTSTASGTLPNPAQEEVSANSPEVRPKAPAKKRGRPKGSKKLKREPEPKVGQPNFLPQNIPPEAGDIRYQYQQQNPYQFNPMMMYQPPPQVHNYYYGHQQGAVHQQPSRVAPPSHAEQRPPSPEVVESSSEEEVEQYIEYPQDTYQEPSLKYRFA